MRIRIRENQKFSNYHLDPKNGPGRLQELELLLQMGGLIKKCFSARAPFNKIYELKESDFLTENEAKYCIDAYNFYFSLQQVINIVGSDSKKHLSIQATLGVLNNQKVSELSMSLENSLKSYSKRIEDIFVSKLRHE